MALPATRFRRVTISALRIDGERDLRRVALYPRLKQLLVRDGYRFRLQTSGAPIDWGRALLLNLSFWSAEDSADVVVGARLPADVVTHVAWHHLARRALGPAGRGADGALLGESIASAFDAYLLGRLISEAPRAAYLGEQIDAMRESAQLAPAALRRVLERLAADPGAAFGELRRLLFEVATSLVRAEGIDDAARRLDAYADRPLAPLLPHYNLSNWILHGRAYGGRIAPRIAPRIARIDAQLRAAPSELDWLEQAWLRPLEP